METTSQRLLRNIILVFTSLLAILIMVVISDLTDRARKPQRVFLVRRIHDTTYVAKPITIVVGTKDYRISLGSEPTVNPVVAPILDNGDIAKANKLLYHDKSTTD